jgi:hypothetical protein
MDITPSGTLPFVCHSQGVDESSKLYRSTAAQDVYAMGLSIAGLLAGKLSLPVDKDILAVMDDEDCDYLKVPRYLRLMIQDPLRLSRRVLTYLRKLHTSDMAQALIDIVEACTLADPSQRPTASKLLDALKEIAARFSAPVCEPPVVVCEVQQQADAPPCAGAVALQLIQPKGDDCSKVCSPTSTPSACSSEQRSEELCGQPCEEPESLRTPAVQKVEVESVAVAPNCAPSASSDEGRKSFLCAVHYAPPVVHCDFMPCRTY